MHPIRFGIQSGQQNVAWTTMLELWRKADAWGYDSLWNFDHFYPILSNPAGPCLEGWTTLAALAQVTSRARVGTLVNGNTYRNPALTAKLAATVDHVSGGRLNLGIGAGWFELEHKSLGFDFKTLSRRLAAFEETLKILKGMFTQEKTTFTGEHYAVEDAMCEPRPLQRPHPPILIGGQGKKVMLRLVAEYADQWNTFGAPDLMRDLIEVIARHGDAVKRDTSAIEKSVAMLFGYRASAESEKRILAAAVSMSGASAEEARKRVMMGPKEECLERVEAYRRAGVTHFIFMHFPPYDLEGLQAFIEEVAPIARRLS